MKIILASKSPRRRELLGRLVKSFDIITAEVDETLPEGLHPRDGVAILAERKGAAIACEMPPSFVIISSDTLVEIDGGALGKPRDEAEAFEMLSRLSGRVHRVHTGVAVHYNGRMLSGTDTTFVKFKALDERTIHEYIKTGEPMDKAGAYGIQGKGGALVERYDGDFNTVVGLSLRLTADLLYEITDGDIAFDITPPDLE